MGRTPRSTSFAGMPLTGSASRSMTAGVFLKNSSHCRTFVAIALWLSITPFGRPVVPDEYGNAATVVRPSKFWSSGGRVVFVENGSAPPTASTGQSGSPRQWTVTPPSAAACSQTSLNIGMVTTDVAPASLIWCASSRGPYVGFDVDTRLPPAMAPWKPTANSGQFGKCSNNVPLAILEAAAATRSGNSPYVSDRPDAAHVTAALSLNDASFAKHASTLSSTNRARFFVTVSTLPNADV
mmetsp:Transcript_874/g.2457  ORF Transcript_874/g.2457 Transcript_874/m.2457 type:complete len:239 (+) Transcript_874:1033-1749(+)